MRWHATVVCSIWICLAGTQASFGDPAGIPFRPGEQLNFAVYWSFIPAGEAVLEVLPSEVRDGVECFHFRATARTLDYIDLFYMVRDRLDAYTDNAVNRSVLFQQIQEGKHKRNVVTTSYVSKEIKALEPESSLFHTNWAKKVESKKPALW